MKCYPELNKGNRAVDGGHVTECGIAAFAAPIAKAESAPSGHGSQRGNGATEEGLHGLFVGGVFRQAQLGLRYSQRANVDLVC